MQSNTHTGVLTVWLERRSYGFIMPDSNTEQSAEIFAHHSDFPDGVPPKNTRVSYTITNFNGRVKATNIRPLNDGGAR